MISLKFCARIVAIIAVMVGGIAFGSSPATARGADSGPITCSSLWFDTSGAQIFVAGQGHAVTTPSGNINFTCSVAFDAAPDAATPQQVCGFVPETCNGQGALTGRGLLICIFDGAAIGPISQAVATPSGALIFSCNSKG